LAAPNKVAASPAEEDVIHVLIIFLSSIGLIFVLFLLYSMVALIAYFKSYWLRNAYKQRNMKGFVWSSLNSDEPYMPTAPSTSRTTLLTHDDSTIYHQPRSIHPIHQLEREKMQFMAL